MTRHKHKKPLIKLRSFYIWHRYMGLAAMLFVFMLATTGIALNHTEGLELDSTAVQSNWLLDWYDIEAPQRMISFSAGKTIVSLVEDEVYINARSIGGHYDAIAGAVLLEELVVVGVDTHVILLTQDGEVVERLTDVNNSVQKILAIGLRQTNELALRTEQGIYLTNIDFTNWQHLQSTDRSISWSSPAIISADLQQQVKQHYRSHVLNLERVMLDIHSGRFFGEIGVLIVDLAAVIFLLLACSGLWIWIQQRHKRAVHRKARSSRTSTRKNPAT